MAQSVLLGRVGNRDATDSTINTYRTMSASMMDFGMRGTRAPRAPRLQRTDRRSRGRLRELCDEVLASYRIAQGQDVVTSEDREIANQVLRGVVKMKSPLESARRT